MNMNQRIAHAIAVAGKSKRDVAKACAVSPSAVTQWTSGDIKSLKPEPLMALARLTGFNAAWIATGQGPEKTEEPNVMPALGPSRAFEYPEISEVQAGNAIEAIDLLQPGEGERHQSDAWAGDHGFWLRVRGDSMTRAGGVSLPEGMIVLVAPGIEPRSGQVIVAKIGNEVTLKQFVIDGDARLLRPFNPSYPVQIMDARWQLVGTVIDAKWPKGVF